MEAILKVFIIGEECMKKKSEIWNEAESKRQIKYGAMISYLSIVINIVAGLLYTPWMIREIGRENFGLYTLATSLISIFLIDFGLGTAVSRFLSKYHAEKKQEAMNNTLGIIFRLYFFITLLISVVLLILYFKLESIYRELTADELVRFKIVYLIIALFSVFSFPALPLNGILTAYEKFIKLNVCNLFNRVFSILLIVLSLKLGFGLYALVTANAISGILTILIKFIIIKRELPLKIHFSYRNLNLIKSIFSFSFWTTVITVAQRFIFNITPSILAAVSGAVSISLFSIGSLIEGYIFTIANAINGLFLPRVSRIVANRSFSDPLLELMIKVGRIQLIMIGLVFIGFLSAGEDFLALWLGKEYEAAYLIAIILVLPSLIDLPQNIADTAITALNLVRRKAVVFIGMATVNILLSWLLSAHWGALGAAISICISYFVRSIGLNIIYYRMKIKIFIFFKECYLKLSLPLVLASIIGFIIKQQIPAENWNFFLIKGALIVILYFFIMWAIGLNPYEKSLFLNLFPPLLKRRMKEY